MIIILYLILKFFQITIYKNETKISNFVFNSLNETEHHTFKLGDDMIKNYKKKRVKFGGRHKNVYYTQ